MLETEVEPAQETTSPAATRAEKREQQVRRILDAAKGCFVRYGFKGAGMQQICAEAGMSPGALYRYFPSKEAIVEAICEADRSEDMSCLMAALSAPSVVEGFVAAAMEHIRHIHEKQNAPLFAEIRAESMRNAAIASLLDRCHRPVSELFAAEIAAATARGEIDPIGGVAVVVPVIMAMGEGLALNDLPASGIDLDGLEEALRAVAVGLLRPRG